MINVVGAGEDPENLTSATFYNFTPTQKKAPEPVKPVLKPEAAVVLATPAASPPESEPTVQTPPLPPSETASTPVVPPKAQKSTSKFIIAGLIVLIVLVGGSAAALYLGQSNQDVRQQASTFIAPEDNLTVQPTQEPTESPVEEVDQLALGPTVSPTFSPTVIPSPTETLTDTLQFCNQSCVTDTNCQNLTHACSNGICRLASNPTNQLCQTPSGNSQVALTLAQSQREYSPFATPAGTALQSGPADWLRYFWIGLSALGVGAVFLLFL